MSDAPTPTATHSPPTETPWQRLPDAEPIRVRDPLAELLGTVPEGEPLVVTFPEVVTAAGHACPAVAGAYRATQLALDRLYPDALPVRSEIAVRVGGDPAAPGFGPMANVIRHVTGAAGERGFAGFEGYGGRADLLSFGAVDGPGRSFRFSRTDADDAVTVSFDPSAVGVDPDDVDGDGQPGGPMAALADLLDGDLSDAERERFVDRWHDRVGRILRAEPGDGSPFTVEAAPAEPETDGDANIIGATDDPSRDQGGDMSQDGSTEAAQTLDAREIDGEPFGDIMAALGDLDEGETLLLINSFEPVPLYDVLSQRGFDHETEQVADDEWHVRISHADAA